jgi:hypothetical protein
MKDTALRVCAVIFALISAVHLCRLILKIKITMGTFAVPLGVSVPGFLVPLCLALWIASLLKEK